MKTLDGTLYRRALDCSGPQSAHTRVVSRAGGQSPLWVNSVILAAGQRLPVYPDKQTISQPGQDFAFGPGADIGSPIRSPRRQV